MKISKKLIAAISSIAIASIIFGMIPFTLSAENAALVGRDIDSFPQGYIDEVNSGSVSGVTVSLNEEAENANGGKSLKFEYSNGGMVNFTNGYWQNEVSHSGYSGIRLWVKNPDVSNELVLVLRLQNNGAYSLNRNADYYIQNPDDETTVIKKATTAVNTSGWDNAGFGEMRIPPSYKGMIYIPLTSMRSLPSAIGRYRIDFFNSAGNGIAYIDDVYLYSTLPNVIEKLEDVELLNFDTVSSTEELKNGMFFPSGSIDYISLDNTVSNTGNSVKFEIGKASANGQFRFNFSKNAALSKMTGLKMWVKNTSEQNTNIFFKFEATSEGGGHRPLKAGSPYYLISEDGLNGFNCITNEDTEAARIILPAGFTGWLYVPFSSAYTVTPAEIFALWICPEKNEDSATAVWLDSVSTYHEFPNCSWTELDFSVFEPNRQNFNSFTDTEEMKKIMYFAPDHTANVSLETEISNSGNSCKIEYSSSLISNFRIGIDKSSRYSECEGFYFWLKNASETNATIQFKLEATQAGGGHRSVKPQCPYYMISDNGSVAYRGVSSKDVDALITVPRNFSGYIYIPFDSIYNMKVNETFAVWINPRSDERKSRSMYVDDISLYSSLPNLEYTDYTKVLEEESLGRTMTLFDFGDYEYTEDMLKHMVVEKNSTVGLELSSTDYGNTVKYSINSANDISLVGFNFNKNINSKSSLGIRYYIKATGGSGFTRFLFKCETTEHRPIKPSAGYYLVKPDGTVAKSGASNDEAGLITIPTDFEGYVYIPFNSLYPTDISNLWRVWINPIIEDAVGKNLYIGNIELYKETPVKKGIENFDFYNNTADFNNDITTTVTTKNAEYAIDSSVKDGKSGNSLKLLTGQKIDELLEVRTFLNSSYNYTEYDGFKFWIKSTGGAAGNTTDIMLQTDSVGRDSFRVGAAYYLDDGKGEMELKFTKNDFGSQEGYISITQGFEGYVYVPFKSAHSSLVVDKLNAIYFKILTADESGRTLYLDSIDCYKLSESNIPGAIWKADTPGMIYGFERADTLTGYRGYITPGDSLMKLQICNTVSNHGKNSLKMNYTVPEDTEYPKTTYISFSMLDEDGKIVDYSGYDGLCFWIKVTQEEKLSKTNELPMTLQIDSPARGRIYGTKNYYRYDKGKDQTSVVGLGNFGSGNAAVEVDRDFEGILYVPFEFFTSFDGAIPTDITKLTKLYLYFMTDSLLGRTVYIDDIKGYKASEITNVDYPGDPDYNPADDTMLLLNNKTVSGNIGGKSNEVNGKSSNAVIIISAAVIAFVIISGTVLFLLIARKRKNNTK